MVVCLAGSWWHSHQHDYFEVNPRNSLQLISSYISSRGGLRPPREEFMISKLQVFYVEDLEASQAGEAGLRAVLLKSSEACAAKHCFTYLDV